MSDRKQALLVVDVQRSLPVPPEIVADITAPIARFRARGIERVLVRGVQA